MQYPELIIGFLSLSNASLFRNDYGLDQHLQHMQTSELGYWTINGLYQHLQHMQTSELGELDYKQITNRHHSAECIFLRSALLQSTAEVVHADICSHLHRTP